MGLGELERLTEEMILDWISNMRKDPKHEKGNRLRVFQAGEIVTSVIKTQGRERLGHRKV